MFIRSCILSLLACSVATAQVRIDRYWTQFPVAELSLVASGINGGVGGFRTASVPVFAQAAVNVEDGKVFTWTWKGLETLDAPSATSPSTLFQALGTDQYEYDVDVHLLPIAPQRWGSGRVTALPYDPLEFDFHYENLNQTTDTTAQFVAVPTDDRWRFAFGLQVESLDYPAFQSELSATVVSREPPGDFLQSLVNLTFATSLRPQAPVELDPQLAVTSVDLTHHALGSGNGRLGERVHEVTLRYTPPGDVNSDGDINFNDFLVFARNFGRSEPAEWMDGDFDYDGDVDFNDFLGLSRNFGTTAQARPASVPEPYGALLIATGLAAQILGRRRRRLSATSHRRYKSPSHS